jgi:hypothetical protein
VLACVLGAAAASAQPRSDTAWARVNVCGVQQEDGGTEHQVGVRGGISGDRRGGRMRLRVTLQWRDPKTGAWAPVDGAATSKWLHSGAENWRRWESGWTFTLEPPAAGTSYELRGVAELQFKRGGRLVRRESRTTASCKLG